MDLAAEWRFLSPTVNSLPPDHVVTEADIRAALIPFQVSWPGDSGLPDEGDRQSLLLSAESTPLVGGETARVRVQVDNPNPFAIPEAWAALQGPAKYLANRLVALGTIPAGGSASGEIEFAPSDGLSVDPLVVRVLVAAGIQPLQEERVALHVEQKPPQLEIEVVRLSDERVSITLQNRGCCHPGQVTVAVRGAVRAFETLLPDEPTTVELPLSGSVEAVTVLLSGAGVRRRIEIPIPDESVRVIPPALELEQAFSLGRSRVEARAESPEGLQEGWLEVDGQKEMYLAWDGSPAGLLSADLGEGEQDVMTKIETISGVSVIDVRQLRAD